MLGAQNERHVHASEAQARTDAISIRMLLPAVQSCNITEIVEPQVLLAALAHTTGTHAQLGASDR